MERCTRCGAPASLATATGLSFCTVPCFERWVRIRRLLAVLDQGRPPRRRVEVVVPDSRYL